MPKGTEIDKSFRGGGYVTKANKSWRSSTSILDDLCMGIPAKFFTGIVLTEAVLEPTYENICG